MEYKFTYRLTEKAQNDLDEIIGYIAVGLCNPSAASDFMNQLSKCIEETRLFSESGTLVDNEFISFTTIRKKFVGNYIIYYKPDIDKHIIYIIRIVYGKRSMNEILAELNI